MKKAMEKLVVEKAAQKPAMMMMPSPNLRLIFPDKNFTRLYRI